MGSKVGDSPFTVAALGFEFLLAGASLKNLKSTQYMKPFNRE